MKRTKGNMSELPRNIPLGKLMNLGHYSGRPEPLCQACKRRSLKLLPTSKQTTLERMQTYWQGEKLTSPALEKLLYSSLTHASPPPVSHLRSDFLHSLSQTGLGASLVKKTIRDMEPDRLHQLGMYEAMARTLRQRTLSLKRKYKLIRVQLGRSHRQVQ